MGVDFKFTLLKDQNMSLGEKEVTRLNLLLSFSALRREIIGCWSVAEALSYRVVFLFPDGSLLTVSDLGQTWLEDRKKDFKKQRNDWSWDKKRGVYVPSKPVKDLGELIVSTVKERGKPRLILPWQDWEQLQDNFLESDEDEQLAECRKFEEQIVNYGATDLWSDCEFTYGEDCLPADCDYVDFEAFVDDLIDENWIVVWDECCGACAAGSIKETRESEPEKAESPAFVIYGQNADSYFGPDGSVRNYMFLQDEKGEGRELELAQLHGFRIAKDEKNPGIYYLNPN